MKRTLNLLSSLVVGMAILVGCSKDRPIEFLQGSDANKVRISDWDHKVYPVETKGVLKNIQTSRAEKVKLSLSYDYDKENDRYFHVNNMDLVEFDSAAALLQKDMPFRALPNKKGIYRICYEVTNTHLLVHKVAQPEFLPSQELTYKRTGLPCLQYGEVAITLAGFHVTLYRDEFVLDSNGDETTRLTLIPVQEKKNATYMQFHPDRRQDFRAATNKLDVFPSNLLEGDWFYNEVYVKTSRVISRHIGEGGLKEGTFRGPHDFYFRPISRVRFIKFKNTLKAINANVVNAEESGEGEGEGSGGGEGEVEVEVEGFVEGEGSGDDDSDQSGQEEDKANLFSAFEIPVTWVDYRIKTLNGIPQLQEEELGDGHPEANEIFQDRAYGKFDFTKMNRTLESTYKSTTMEELEVDENYLSFTLTTDLDRLGFISIKYSFKRAERVKNEQARYAKTRDGEIFGIYYTRKDYIDNSPDYYRTKDIEKTLLINKFMFNEGESREIVYHFTRTSSPMEERWRDVGRRAVKAWNEAFQKAFVGTNKEAIRVVLKEFNDDGSSADLSLGDLRGNLINIVDHDKESTLVGGYGPSVIDTLSGEIISATTNIYVPGARDLLKRTIRNYLIYKLDGYENATFERAMPDAIVSVSPLREGDLFAMNLSLYETSLDLKEELKEEVDPILRSVKGDRLDLIDTLLATEDKEVLKRRLKEKRERSLFLALSQEMGMEALLGSSDHRMDREIFELQRNVFEAFENYPLTYADLIGRIEKACNNYPKEKEQLEVGKFLARLKREGEVNYTASIPDRVFISGSEEKHVLNECADRLLPDVLTASAIHEMGHNFALLHNFAASGDEKNFTKLEDNEGKTVNSSSAMDYLSFYVQDLLKVGSYDVAALRYIYAEQIELVGKDGGRLYIELVDPEEKKDNSKQRDDIYTRVQNYVTEKGLVGVRLREFKYCSDRDAKELRKDPMCAQFDYGSNPLEVVRNIISGYYASLEVYGQRLDFWGSASPKGMYISGFATFGKLFSFYQHWRYLFQKLSGEDDRYLDLYKTQKDVERCLFRNGER